MDATCAIQDSIHAFSLIHKYVSRILGTYQKVRAFFLCLKNPHIRNLKTSRVEYSQGGSYDEKYQIPPCTDR